MKKIIPAFLLFCSLIAANKAEAQACGNSGPSACTANGSVSGQGFESMDSVPCIVKDSAYSQAVQFNMYSSFNFQGQQEVDSIEFVSLTNLPCGICWASSDPNNRFKAGEPGCLHFTGTTADSAGQYKLAITLTAWINHTGTGLTIPPSLVNQTGIALYLRVSDATVACAPVDTSSSATNLTASTSCPTAITDIAKDISAMSIVPNPMNSGSQLSFTAQTAGSYLLKISNIAGQEVSLQEVRAINGLNQVTINRNNLSNGVYLVSLSNGQSSITRKLVVID